MPMLSVVKLALFLINAVFLNIANRRILLPRSWLFPNIEMDPIPADVLDELLNGTQQTQTPKGRLYHSIEMMLM
jgi:hypothetical protein